MERENSIVEEKPNPLFPVDETFWKKLLSRKTLKGQSTRMLDNENVVSVPFDWEMKPGTPKHPQTDNVVPLIKPSPAVESQNLMIPSFAFTHTTMTSCFWNKPRKNHRQGKKMGKGNAKSRRGRFHSGNNVAEADGEGNHTPESVELSDVNAYSTSSSDHSRSCSSSSSLVSNSSCNSNSSSNSSSLRSFAKGLIKWSF
ncbi:hypothetical protein Gohar_021678 [Gossypium harknessii]|uniref:Uncharacterized protein n=1 Tax=Gossypium harknessii TaxID=34285 RepID=A0A7J9I9H3_9ROSI|nr:hypothetical protein [Gossypium harknessii]